jgi:hypothetical protein
MFATTPTRFIASMAAAFALVAGAAQASPVKDPPAAAGPAVTLDPDTTPTQGTVTSVGSATFVFKAAEADQFECSLDGSQYKGCKSPEELTGLGGGNHVFRVRAVDVTGVAGAPAERDWHILLQAMPTPTPRPGR